MKLFKKYGLDILFNDSNLDYKGVFFYDIDYSNIINDNFIVQGICKSDEYFFISAYSKDKVNSRVYIYKDEFIKYVELDNNSHVGGITYCDKGYLFITEKNGKVNCYKYDNFIRGEVVPVECDINISNELEGNVSAATLYYYDGCLYVCTCSCIGRMVKYKLLDDLSYEVSVYNNLPACIQGICVFKYMDNLYYLFSQSYSKTKSCIKLLDSNFNFIGQYISSFIGIEGIELDKSGNIMGIFEKNISHSVLFNISMLRGGLKSSLEKKYYIYGDIHQKKIDNIKKRTL